MRKKHKNYNKIKNRAHDKLVDKIFREPELFREKIGDYVYYSKDEKIGIYTPDLIFICKTNKTEKDGLYKFLVVEAKSQGFGDSIRKADIKLYRILDDFIYNKNSLIKKYAALIPNKEPNLKSLYFGYRLAFRNDFNGVEIIKPTTWEDRDP